MSSIVWILVFLLYNKEKLTKASEPECKGVRCYNNGTFEYHANHCVCRCPEGFSGLLCEFQLYASNWPLGPYALPMPYSGCPESRNHGWAPGYVDVTTSSPFTIWRHASDITNLDFNITEIVIAEEGTNLRGSFKQYFLRLNFCVKLADHTLSADVDWPRGDYSVFGATEGCPDGFAEETHMLNLPPIKSWSMEGYLPFIRINMLNNTLVTRYCRKQDVGPLFPGIWSSFVFMKYSGASCSGQVSNYSIIEETLTFEGVSTDNSKNLTTSSLSYCNYWNPITAHLFTCEEYEFDCGRGHCISISALCDGFPTCAGGFDETDESCALKCSDTHFHCGRGHCVLKNSVCDGIRDCPNGRDELAENCVHKCFGHRFACDGGLCLEKLLVCDGYPDCWDETDEEFAYCEDMLICDPDELPCVHRDCIWIWPCNTTDKCSERSHTEGYCPEGSFHCERGDCIPHFMVCDGEADCTNAIDELESNCHKRCVDVLYYCSEEECISLEDGCQRMYGCGIETEGDEIDRGHPIVCLDELGMADGTIEDFQISATSWTSSHPAQMARPTLDSWCPASDDLDPYLQIDLFSPAVIGGLVLYNRVETKGKNDKNIYQEIRIPVGCRFVTISYALFPTEYRLYKERPFEVDLSRNFSEPQQFTLIKPFLARYVRVHPKGTLLNGVFCARVELVGCKNPGQLTDECETGSDISWVPHSQLQPVTSRQSLSDILYNFNSTGDCQAACEQELGDNCAAVIYRENVSCDIYPRSDSGIQYGKISDVTPTELQLRVCWADSSTQVMQPRGQSWIEAARVWGQGTITSKGYPFTYPADLDLFWNLTSAQGKYLTLTFVDIYLNEKSDLHSRGCDTVSVNRQKTFKALVTLDSRYNGRVVTVPLNELIISMFVTFITCPRNARSSNTGRGFRLIYRQEDRPMYLFGLMKHEGSMGQIAYPLLGIFTENSQTFSINRLSEITFHFFNVPCSEDFTFTVTGVPYCNNNRPRKNIQGFEIHVVFSFRGNLTLFFPEGFSASVVKGHVDFPHRQLVSSKANESITSDWEEVSHEMRVCSNYLGKCYLHIEKQGERSWTLDSFTCHEFGYTLFNFHSQSEVDFVASWMTEIYYDLQERTKTEDRRLYYTTPLSAYIGLLRYMGANGQDQIWENGARVSYSNWGSGEPRDVFSNLCTEMVVAKLTRETYWRTTACHVDPPTSNIGIVCETPLDTVPATVKPIFTRSNGSKSTIPQIERSRLFPCSGGEWVHSLAVCDGIPDCFDGSDEIGCEKEKQDDCSEDEFTCTDGTCIQLDQVCNHVIDCSPHGNDEFCNLPRCQDGQFQCESSQCVPSFTRCDSVPDCLDESDEIGCVSCNESNSFLCGDLSCIHESRVCDRYRDCIDGRDEQGCDPPFTTCYNLWLTGTETNVTQRTVHNKTEVNIECKFHVSEDNTLTVMTYIEVDNTWEIGTMNNEISLARQRIITSDYNIHGNLCKQEFAYSCLDNMMEVARYYDPHFNGTYRYCAPSTTTIYFTFNDRCDVISSEIVPADVDEPFHIFDYCDEYVVTVVNRKPQNVTVGAIVCQSVYHLSDEIRCGDGRRSSANRRCLYDIGRAGNVEGCRSYKHLENCENFECPQDYVKCHRSFCLAMMFVCDGERQCPGGDDEQSCLRLNRTSSIAIVYHGSADEQTRPYIFRFARQLYSSTHEIHTIHFYKKVDSDAFYKVTRKPVHPFSESLNKETEETVELHGNDIVSTAASMHMNDSMLTVIYIDDDATTRRLSSAQVPNHPALNKVYRLTIDPTMDIVARVTTRSAKETDVIINNWNRLWSTGNILFPDICADGTKADCAGQYKCSSSQICIPIYQMCNGKTNCPFGDDEDMCDFRCHDRCSCYRYIADCSWSNFTLDDMAALSDTTRKLDIGYNEMSSDGVFFIERPFPQLIHLKAVGCGIRLIKEHTFNMTSHLLYLDLRQNNIQAIQRYTFDSLKILRVLRLDGNFDIRNIDQYSFTSLVSLYELVIRHTKIEEILPNTFSGLDVNVLDISDNHIQKVHGYAMNDLSVADLRMDGNSLHDFDTNIFSGIRNLKRLMTPAFKFCCYKPASLPEENCLPAKDEFSSCDDLMRNSALQTLLWIIGIAALIGNACVIVYRIVYDRERLKIGFGMFVTNLALSDFLMGVYMITIAIADLSFRNRYIEMEDYWRNSGWCTFAGILATVSSETSVLFLCLITIDRLLVIKFPFGQIRFDVKKASLFAALSWVFAVIVAIIPILYTAYFKDRFYSTTGVCIALPLTRSRPPGWLYSFLIFICLNFLTFILIAAGQFMIYREIKLNTRRMKKVSSKRRNDLKIARNLFLVLLTDFLCWFPIGVMGILALRGHEIPGDVYAWTAVLILPINSALNPFLYTIAAIIGKKSFSPRVDEQTKPIIEGVSEKFIKFYNSKAIVPMDPNLYDTLADLLQGNTTMTTREILAVAVSVVRTFRHLHDMGLVHGDLDVSSVLIDRRMIGQVSLKIQPKKIRARGSTEKDIYDVGHVIRHLLRLTKTA